MSNTPWNSIAESVVPSQEGRLSYKEVLTSPCHSCPTSPCCTYLPLHTFNIRNILELDHAIYLLNFDRIELGLSASGNWSVYYRYPCRFLNRTEFTCSIHNTPEQPQICVNYNPYRCWYKRVLTKSVSDEFLRIDRQRMEYIIPLLAFDESGNILEIPNWETLVEGIAKLPREPNSQPSDPPSEDPVTETWKQLVLNPESGVAETEKAYTYAALGEPCSGCQAYCCKTLVFPQALPIHTTNLDFLKFCLGFPGIELGIADDTWSIVVKTTCRHLQDNCCSVYGKSERPLLCKYYDAWKCTYKPHFGTPRPGKFLRVQLEQFQWLTESFSFDENGTIVQFPPIEAIRIYIEERWRTAAVAPTVQPTAADSIS